MTLTTPSIICALDTNDMDTAITLGRAIGSDVWGFKLGLEFFTRHGYAGVQQLGCLEAPIFLDLKLHDIPNTVAKSAKTIAHLNINMLTVHTQGGHAMMQEAIEAVKEESDKLNKKPPLVMGVTLLTSMNQADLNAQAIETDVRSQVLRLAQNALDAGIDGIVCSSHELEAVKHQFGDALKTVVPGIRPPHSDANDQKRVMTPKEAMNFGADYLVIGRPITQSPDPLQAVRDIVDGMF